MDFPSCCGLAVLELVALQSLHKLDSLTTGTRTFFFIFLLQYITLKFYRVILYPHYFSPLRHLPGPKDHNLLLGQEVNKYKADSPVYLQLQWSRQWPGAPFIRYLSFAGREVLVVNSLAAHKAVLQTHVYDFIKPPLFARLVGEITGTGLLFAEGDEHRHQRRLLAGPFSVPSMRKILPVFQEKAVGLSRAFEDAVGDKDYGSIEVVETFSRATMGIIGVTALGIELDALSLKYPLGFWELYNRVLHQGPLGQLISSINAFVPIRPLVPLKANYRFIQANEDLRKMLREIITERMTNLSHRTNRKNVAESRDLLTYMLEEAQAQQEETGKQVWEVDDIIGHLLNFTSAGHETTANALAWALYVLSTNHEMQVRLRVEIKTFLESAATPGYDEISGLPYLHNFVRELLRVYSPALMAPRQAAKDLVIEGITVPKGTQVDLSVAIMHSHESVWGPDAAVFNLDRWDNLTGDSASPFAFQAFIQGPRICPGKSFAMIEIKAIIIELVSNWHFLGIERWGGEKGEDQRELLSGGEEEIGKGVRFENPSLTYRPAGGLLVRFQRL